MLPALQKKSRNSVKLDNTYRKKICVSTGHTYLYDGDRISIRSIGRLLKRCLDDINKATDKSWMQLVEESKTRRKDLEVFVQR